MEENDRIEIKTTKVDAKPDAKTYEIATIQDMLDCVTTDNIDQFLKEFEICFRSLVLMKAIGKSVDGSDKLKWTKFNWIDD